MPLVAYAQAIPVHAGQSYAGAIATPPRHPAYQPRTTPAPMNKVKAGLRGLNPSAKALRAAIVYTHMNGNPNFPNPSPSMAEFHAAYIELKEANLAALDRGRMALARRDRAVERIDMCLTRLAAYVNGESLGDTLKLTSSGFEMAKRGSPINTLQSPASLTVRPTAYPGQVKLRWQRVPGAIMYVVERSTSAYDQPEQWERVDETSRPQYTLQNMEPHAPLRFRVRALGTKVKGPYSAIAHGVAA